MNLVYCSITGPDDQVDPAKLAEISARYPFVEWAIPFHPELTGTPRYPTPDWVERFHTACPKVHKATHLCCEGLRMLMDGIPDVLSHISRFPRVQLNFGFGFDVAQIDPNALVNQVTHHPETQFILQYNAKTSHLLPLFDGVDNIAVLHDASAGTGLELKDVPPPVSGRFCGYAGGFGPDNVGNILDAISSALPGNAKTWIDMETRVRTDNTLDLGKVLTVLEIVNLHASRPSADATSHNGANAHYV